jgi:hypothetical protein
MTRVPQVLPSSLGPTLGCKEAAELARLEAQRDRLLDEIANRKRITTKPIPLWLRMVMIVLIAGIGFALLAGVLAGQIARSLIVGLIVIVGLSIFVWRLKVRMPVPLFYFFELVFLMSSALTSNGVPYPLQAGKPDARTLLADCEAKISKLKEGRS